MSIDLPFDAAGTAVPVASAKPPARPRTVPVRLNFQLQHLDSPVGPLMLVTDAQHRVRALEFAENEARLRSLLAKHYRYHTLDEPVRARRSPADPVVEAVERYFAGELQALDALAVADHGSPLQRRVWAALRQIPAGQVTSYGDLARRVGIAPAEAACEEPSDAATPPRDMAIASMDAMRRAGRLARAVGRANALNPISIIVPCHRVIGADGRLTGYAGGLARKRWLLLHEGAVADASVARLQGF